MSTAIFAGIILASESPRRRKLLKSMDVEFQVIPSGLVEMPPMGDTPNAYSARMAMEKAVKIGQDHPEYLVIGADTVVAIDDHVMGKPASKQEASLMLSRLSGRWHEVWTGFCVYCGLHNIQIVKAVKSSVRFRDLTLDEIEQYIETGEPMDKAGAYAIQGRGNTLVREIKGSYHNVIGLPTLELGKTLDELGICSEHERGSDCLPPL
jgi:septum formation protein